jgi:hypothetical protein
MPNKKEERADKVKQKQDKLSIALRKNLQRRKVGKNIKNIKEQDE